jgi:hypothetical protein
VALLSPIVVRRLRDGGTEKSIQSFHQEHEVLSRQDYTVAPAHRLAQPDQPVVTERFESSRPRLTVVHPEDTYSSLESRSSWDEWSEDYDYDDREQTPRPATNRYAQAYSSRPSEPSVSASYQPPIRKRTMKAQRRMMFMRLVIAALVMTLAAFFIGGSIIVDLAAATWACVVVFVALALYAVSQGYLSDSSLPLRMPKRRPLARVEPLYSQNEGRYTPRYEEEFTSEFYEPDANEQWHRESERRQALG